jgi:YtkA-like protein
MTRAGSVCALAATAIAICLPAGSALAQVRARADVACRPAGAMLQYDCTITLTNARTGEPLPGVTLTVGADMPSMPMMHNVRPVQATPGADAGIYQARLTLEMHCDWSLQVNLSGPLRDRLVTILRFDPDRVTPAASSRARPGHKH